MSQVVTWCYNYLTLIIIYTFKCFCCLKQLNDQYTCAESDTRVHQVDQVGQVVQHQPADVVANL